LKIIVLLSDAETIVKQLQAMTGRESAT